VQLCPARLWFPEGLQINFYDFPRDIQDIIVRIEIRWNVKSEQFRAADETPIFQKRSTQVPVSFIAAEFTYSHHGESLL
jgi:hypothetical protein